jgi:hypothetical protein
LLFSILIKYFEKLEKTSSTHATIQTLASMLKETKAADIDNRGEVSGLKKEVAGEC